MTGPDGVPAGGVKVQVVGADHNPGGDFRQETQSAADGSFTMDVDRDKYYLIAAQKENLVSTVIHRTIKAAAPSPIELKLGKATRVFGRATGGPGNLPLSNANVQILPREDSYSQLPPEQQLPGNNPVMIPHPQLVWMTSTSPQGNFEAYVAPGEYGAYVYAGAINVSQELEVSGAPLEVNFHSEQSPNASNLLTGRVVLADQPQVGVAEATILGMGAETDTFVSNVTSDKQGNFIAQRGKGDLYLCAVSSDKTLGGMVRVKATDSTVTLPVGKTASAHGRLVDPAGKPLAEREIHYGFQIGDRSALNNDVKTDANGVFIITGLVPGYNYNIEVELPSTDNGRPNSFSIVGDVLADKPSTVELGNMTLTDHAR